MKKDQIDKIIKGFFVTEEDYENQLCQRIKKYIKLGFRVRKPATHYNDIIYPHGHIRSDEINKEILMLCYWLINTVKQSKQN